MRTETERSYHERILRVLVFIQTHLDEALSLEELARVAHFSPFHFHRVFRGLVGESVKEHVRRLRLERAAQRLRFSEESATSIAFGAGYEAHEAFTRAFRAMFGCSPSQFRARRRAPITLARSASGVHYAPDGRSLTYHLPEAGGSPMNVRIENRPAQRVIFMRHVGPYDQVGGTWQRLFA